MIRTIMIVFALASFPMPANAVKLIYLGGDFYKCSAWNTANDGDSNKVAMIAWIWGALSGMAIESGHDFLRPATPMSLKAEVDRICRLKPLTTFDALTIEISKNLGD